MNAQWPEAAFPDGHDWGIQPGYLDENDHWRGNSERLTKALQTALKPDPGGSQSSSQGQDVSSGSDPDQFPPTGKFPAPADNQWGWNVQLYSLRSQSSWGIGDLGDLRSLGQWASGLGARFLQVNPLSAALPRLPVDPSPYIPSSRRFLNPVYLAMDRIPGVEELTSLSEEGRSLNNGGKIDWDAVLRIKMKALELLWPQSKAGRDSDPDFHLFVEEAGNGLRQYACFCVLAEHHGPDWRNWPQALRNPASESVAGFAVAHEKRLCFHQWIQWLLDRQLMRVADAVPLILDLPVGFNPGGADAWAWQSMLALDMEIGSPPDGFNPNGQNWGLPPFLPGKLKDCGYAPLRETLRAVLRHAAGIRVDHVAGWFRLFWIPNGFPASEGGYVRYPYAEILAVAADECSRTGAYAVGEDLGTISPTVRRSMAEWGMLGSKVLWFEPEHPSDFPAASMASLSTHDLPTLAGLHSGYDVEEQRALGMPVDPEGMRASLERLLRFAQAESAPDARQRAKRVHELLAKANSCLVSVSLEDALLAEQRPNLPGSAGVRPNWCIPLPKILEEILQDKTVREIADAMNRGRGGRVY
jgi:4-alpha-glucanotransferase